VKIIGGKFRGRNFYMPAGIRPTQDIARKALFDILGQDLEGVTLLDLFAGSGAIGLEAISRGAAKATMVEKDPKCAAVIGENISLLLGGSAAGTYHYEVIQSDAFAVVKLFARQGRKFDVVFIDPPYGRELAKKALKTLEGYDILQPNCMVVIQHEKREILPQKEGRFLLYRQKNYGTTFFSIYNSNNTTIVPLENGVSL
jgi:16S rRNA (guanine966-N2)-methyltransferase